MLLLLLLPKHILARLLRLHPTIRIVGLECRLLRRKTRLLAEERLRAKLVENARLGRKSVGESILITSLLGLLLEAGRLSILIV